MKTKQEEYGFWETTKDFPVSIILTLSQFAVFQRFVDDSDKIMAFDEPIHFSFDFESTLLTIEAKYCDSSFCLKSDIVYQYHHFDPKHFVAKNSEFQKSLTSFSFKLNELVKALNNLDWANQDVQMLLSENKNHILLKTSTNDALITNR